MKKKVKGPVLLMILDGWGIRKERPYNAPAIAKTPFLDYYWRTCPHATLKASGKAVGLPAGFQGNSEVGHLNLGAGRIVRQAIDIINHAIASKEFYANPALVKTMENCKRNGRALHLMGLIQQEGVHAMTDHCIALLKMAKSLGLPTVHIHAFTDGRDTPAKSAHETLGYLQHAIDTIGIGEIVTVIGRFYAMDRDTRWPRIKIAYDLITAAKGARVSSWKEALDNAYASHDTDEFIRPHVIGDYAGIRRGESIIHFNYRLDRARELTQSFIEPRFRGFQRKVKGVSYCCMMPYYPGVSKHSYVAFPNVDMRNILGEVLEKAGKRQLRIAETEKYAHVTFFFNSQKDRPFMFEDRILVPSPREVKTYDQKPEMSAEAITHGLLARIQARHYDVIVLNFANGDMVGHTGNWNAAKAACEAVDRCVGMIIPEILLRSGVVLITADHGNCEEMSGKHKTSHTTNTVPFIVVGSAGKVKNGVLADIAPTILSFLGLKIPKEMTGTPLIDG